LLYHRKQRFFGSVVVYNPTEPTTSGAVDATKQPEFLGLSAFAVFLLLGEACFVYFNNMTRPSNLHQLP
jgi:hypothetical protein